MKRSRSPPEDCDGPLESDQDVAAAPAPKLVTLDSSAEAAIAAIQCSLPGHAPGLKFTTYDDYEKHYSQVHTNRCLECRRNLPSAHALDLHIQENHDALAKIQREKGEPTYACFVETCAEKFKGIRKREEHLMKSHQYPANYFFAVTKFGIDGRSSMLVEERKGKGKQQRGPRDRQIENKSNIATAVGKAGSEATSSNDVRMKGAEATNPSQKATLRHSIADEKAGVIAETEAPSTQQDRPAVDAEMDDLAGAMSTLRFVPRAVRMNSKQKAGSARR